MRWLIITMLWLLAATPSLIFALNHHYGIHDHSFWLDQVKYNPLVRFPEFLLGVGLAVFFRNGLRIAHPLVMAAFSVATIIGIAIATSGNPYPAMHDGLLAPSFALLLMALASSPTLLGTPILLLLGEASYSLYLIHVAIRDAIGSVFYQLHLAAFSPLFVIVYLASCISASVICCKYIEVPAKRWILSQLANRRQIESGRLRM